MSASRDTGSSRLVKRSLTLHGHATSVALEAAFWSALEGWARREHTSVSDLIASVDRLRDAGSLASAIRVAVLRDALEIHETSEDRP